MKEVKTDIRIHTATVTFDPEKTSVEEMEEVLETKSAGEFKVQYSKFLD